MTIDAALIALIIAVILLAIALGVFLFLLRLGRVAAPAGKPEKTSARNSAMSRGVREAVSALREKVPGRKFEQRVPWVLLIGEAGGGRTTLADHLGEGSNRLAAQGDGVQWNFLDGGALIEIPGAFLVDAEGREQRDGRWKRLLRLLVRHRSTRPIDGVVLTIAATRLIAVSETDTVHRNTVATSIRNKLDEAQKILGLTVPVYVVVTKCDQIRGFGSFCREMNPDLEDDIFGWSNPNTLESAFAPAWIDEAFDAVQKGILIQQMRAFGSRTASSGTDELFIFPLEFDAMRVPLRDFLTQIFRETSYVDSNFARGVYFCGDVVATTNRTALSIPGIGNLPLVGSGSTIGVSSSLVPTSPAGRHIVFARHLFNFKIFLESKIARPVTRIRFSRNRMVLACQAAILIVVFVLMTGSIAAWRRLADLRDHRFLPLLQNVADTLPARGGLAPRSPSVQTAYDLVDTLSEINTNGFWSVFLPASWGDPVNQRVTTALTGALGRTVLPAISSNLDDRAEKLTGNCSAMMTDESAQQQLPHGEELSFTKDPHYAALEKFLNSYAALEEAIGEYDRVRRVGGGSFTDLDALFQYLLGKRLADARRIASSYYYQQALARTNGDPLPVTQNGKLDHCAAQLTSSLLDNFFASWLRNNPLLTQTAGIAKQINELQAGNLATADGLSSLAEDVRDLDADVSGASQEWLAQPGFDLSQYPALKLLTGRRFASPEFMRAVEVKGEDALTNLRQRLFSTAFGSNAILEQRGAEFHVSGPVIALESGIEALLHQDFMDVLSSANVSPAAVIWNISALNQAAQLRDSYDKFVRERMPLLPPDLRAPLQRIGARNLNAAVSAVVARAETPATGNDDATTLLEIRSFKDAAPVLAQLQESLPAGAAVARASFQTVLDRQAIVLGQRLNQELDTHPPYALPAMAHRGWNQTTPVSDVLFAVDSPDAMEEFLASERERIHSLATDYAQPLAGFVQARGLQRAASFDRWANIVRDVKDYDAKKPGNPMAALEAFIRTNLDKITPANACRATDVTPRGGDYFLQIRSEIQRTAVNWCSQTALQEYAADIAGFFNSRLAGKFPFGPLPATPDAVLANPRDVGEFLSRIDLRAGALVNFASQNPAWSEITAFLNRSLAVRQMFAGGFSEGTPFTDVAVSFRANQRAEKSGNEIIEWEFQSGDQTIRYPGTENGIRWHFGDPVRLTLRYAKDSPDIPRVGGASDLRVDGRSVTWEYPSGWSLFAMLAAYGGQASEFGQTADTVPGTMRFVIQTVPDTSRTKPAGLPRQAGETRVYVRLAMRVPGAKEPREIPVSTFPFKAPMPPTESGSVE